MSARASSSSAAPTRSLAGFELFDGIKASDREALERRCAWRAWPAGAMAVGHETTGASVHFVVAGRCRVVARMPRGKRDVVLDEIGPGGFFGEIAAIDREPRSAAVTALVRTHTAELDGETFMAFLADHPVAARRLMRRLTEVIRQADTAILELSGLDAQARIYTELLRRARTGGALPANVGMIAPVPRHGDIAARAATARETVARVLGTLAKKGLVSRESERLLINDVRALTGMVEASESDARAAVP